MQVSKVRFYLNKQTTLQTKDTRTYHCQPGQNIPSHTQTLLLSSSSEFYKVPQPLLAGLVPVSLVLQLTLLPTVPVSGLLHVKVPRQALFIMSGSSSAGDQTHPHPACTPAPGCLGSPLLTKGNSSEPGSRYVLRKCLLLAEQMK